MNFMPDNNQPCLLSGHVRLFSFVLQLQDVFGQMPRAPDSYQRGVAMDVTCVNVKWVLAERMICLN